METNYNLVWIVIALVSIICIVVVGVLIKNRSTGTGSTAPATSTTPPPTTPPAPAPAGGHTSGGGFLRNLLIFLVVVVVAWLLVVFVWPPLSKSMGIGEIPALRTQSSGSVAQTPPVSTKWVSFTAPDIRAQRLRIEGEGGYTTTFCTPTTDPGCTDTVPHGFRLWCVGMDDVVRDQSTDACKHAKATLVQSTGAALAMQWRYRPD